MDQGVNSSTTICRPLRELSLDLATLRQAYLGGALEPLLLVEELIARLAVNPRPEAWITLVTAVQLRAAARALQGRDPRDLPLYGIPFAVKDNIDVTGLPTTAACPSFEHLPEHTATVVEHLVDAGALLIGKTNLDQFATGLNGTRSPYGAVRNSFDERLVSGGSSSGSAVAVAVGLASFALGTDTAGSGRVPAAFNNLVGLKPTRGLVSNYGVVPACRSLDCVSILALCVDDARQILDVIAVPDSLDAYSRAQPVSVQCTASDVTGLRFAVPRADQLEFYDDRAAATAFMEATQRIAQCGGELVEIDFAPFGEVARLLYEGPWIAERTVAIERSIRVDPSALDPVVRAIVERGHTHSATDAFAAQYRLRELRKQVDQAWRSYDLLLIPTAPAIYSIEAMRADPVRLNSNLGHYTNFVNLLDLSAIAVPGPLREDGLPSGFTLCAPAFAEPALLRVAEQLHPHMIDTVGATGHKLPVRNEDPAQGVSEPQADPARIDIMVCGAHMSGLPLNHELTQRGAQFVRRANTAARYRLHALESFEPPRPGLVRVSNPHVLASPDGRAIEVEIWSLPAVGFGQFVAGIPHPLCIGTVALDDGSEVSGFLCEAYATQSALDISELGSWRAYVDQRAEQSTHTGGCQ